MILTVAIMLAFIVLIFCVIHSIPLGFALVICWLIFFALGLREQPFLAVCRFAIQGAKTSVGVIKTLLLIGATIGIWMASGTIATIVYDAFELINPQFFVVVVFIVCALVSFLIGTSLGTVSVVGLPLMLIAKSGHVAIDLVAGAIMAGIYFGDRCSPLSSSASLVATVTYTNLFENIKRMFRSSWPALLVSLIGYGLLSWHHPLRQMNQTLLQHLQSHYAITWVLLIPAALILILSLLRRPISQTILISIGCSLIIGLWLHPTSWSALLQALVLGWHPQQATVIQGGGLVSMLNPVIVVLFSCSIAGILNQLSGFKMLEQRLTNAHLSPASRFGRTLLFSVVTGGIGCNQSVAVIMTNTLVRPNYDGDATRLAAELENSCILTAALLPWNIAAFVPTAILGVSFAGYLPFALYLYAVPLLYWLGQTHWFQKLKPAL